MNANRNRNGQGLIEVVAGMVALVPIMLFLLDLGFSILCCQIADDLARDAARVAATQKSASAATASAAAILSNFKTSTIITNVALAGDKVTYQPNDEVSVQIALATKLPVPFPFINNNPEFKARAVQPVLAKSM